MLPLLVLVLAIGSGARTFAGEEDAGTAGARSLVPRATTQRRARQGGRARRSRCCSHVRRPRSRSSYSTGSSASTSRSRMSDRLSCRLSRSVSSTAGSRSPSAPRTRVEGSRSASLREPPQPSYLVGGLHELAGWLDPFRFVSTFWLVGSSPLQTGADALGTAIVLAAAVVVLVLGALLVERRDLETP